LPKVLIESPVLRRSLGNSFHRRGPHPHWTIVRQTWRCSVVSVQTTSGWL